MLSLTTNLGKLRTWIQNNCVRGDTIIFGGDEKVEFRRLVTYRDFEDIVIKTVNQNKSELIKEFMEILEDIDKRDTATESYEKNWQNMMVQNKINSLKEFLQEHK